MIQPSYPGVYVQERPSGVRTITGVPTAIAAFVGYTRSGLEHRPVRIQSFADFERGFGGLAADSVLSYAVSHYFLNGGAEAVVVRVPRADAAAATITILDEAGQPSLRLAAISTGAWGDALLAEVTYAAGSADGFQLSLSDPATGRSETFVDLSIDPAAPRFVAKVVNDPDTGSGLVRVEPAADDAARPARTRSVSPPVTLDAAALVSDKRYALAVTVDQTGGRLADLDVTVLDEGDPIPSTLAELCALLERRITAAAAAAAGGAVGAIRCAPVRSGDEVSLALWAELDQAKLPGSLDAVVTVEPGPDDNDAAAMLQAAFGLDDPFAVTPNVSRYHFGTARGAAGGLAAATPGDDGATLPGAAEIVGNAGDDPEGLGCLERVDLFTLLCIPDATRPRADDPGTSDLDDAAMALLWSEALALCVRRRAFLLVDPPPQIRTPAAAVGWKNERLGLRGNHGAVNFPRLRAPDPLDRNRLRSFAPSGAVAGIYARTDANRGVWKAPAGIDAFLTGVEAPELPLTDAQHGLLNPLGVNALRRFPVYGTVCFGARTIDGADELASEWKYVPVRRVANYIEESLYRGLKWVVFEPNDEPLWSQIRTNVRAFMQDMFVQGAFAGATPRDAYLVKCDRETTTPSDVNRGIVNILVGFAPLKPAEFVMLTLTQLAGQASG